MPHIKSPWSTFRRCVPIINLTVVACLAQTPRQSTVLNRPVDQHTAVSFFWFGDMESHWRDPMNFYVANANDPKLHRVSIGIGFASRGVETWITASEMQTLVAKLLQSHFEWVDSRTVLPLQPWSRRTDGHDSFDITLVSARGTVRASVRLARMCDELLQFDSVMPTPRLKWQFQTMRWDDGCVIAGYHNEASPKQ
jgi:hypothetical protein